VPRLTPIHYRRLIKIFEKDGFTFLRQKGDHRSYSKPGVKRPVIIPEYNPVPVWIIERNLKTAGMSRQRYFELLEKV
jgi:predicted RNA binding protein YcfA (HicA-like mRNA interferase family)